MQTKPNRKTSAGLGFQTFPTDETMSNPSSLPGRRWQGKDGQQKKLFKA